VNPGIAPILFCIVGIAPSYPNDLEARHMVKYIPSRMSSGNERARAYANVIQLGKNYPHSQAQPMEFIEPIEPPVLDRRRSNIARVYNRDVMNLADLCLTAGGCRPVALLEANANYPDPGMTKGGMQGQESEILLRTNYGRAIYDGLYPLPRRGLLYTEKVSVLMDAKYGRHPKPYNMPILAVPVLRRPATISEQVDGGLCEKYGSRLEEALMRDSIYSMFAVASEMEYDVILAPALGCDVGHPVHQVIGFFNEAMVLWPSIRFVFFGIVDPAEDKPLFRQFHQHVIRGDGTDPAPEAKSVSRDAHTNGHTAPVTPMPQKPIARKAVPTTHTQPAAPQRMTMKATAIEKPVVHVPPSNNKPRMQPGLKPSSRPPVVPVSEGVKPAARKLVAKGSAAKKSVQKEVVPDDECIPEAEPVIPEEEAVVPDAEPVVPDAEPVVPDVEAVVPEAEAVVEESEQVVPDVEPVVPDVEPEPAPIPEPAPKKKPAARPRVRVQSP
jgi:hypothetical protein